MTRGAVAWVFTVGVVAGETCLAVLLRPYLTPGNLAMIYLLGLVAVAARSTVRASVLTALVSMAAFDLFCVPPYLTFAVGDLEYLVTFVAMIAVAFVISVRTERIRTQAREAEVREEQARTLYQLSNRLASETRIFDTVSTAARVAGELLPAQVVIFPAADGAISFRRRTSESLPVPNSEETIARWVFTHGRKAGRGVDELIKATALYVPLQGTRDVVGVMALIPSATEALAGEEQQVLIEMLANQIALAMERAFSQNAEEASRLKMHTEQMRSSLLSAASHDLRTPLASILGAASTLRQQGERLAMGTREELLDSIAEEAERLSRLVGNLLEMVRFESGGVELRRDAYPLEEIVGTALHRLGKLLNGREVTTDLPPGMPLVYGDDVLLGQVFVNLLENAVKYTPEHSAIEISGTLADDMIRIEVRDHGAGLVEAEADRVFEKFHRGSGASVAGAGLGLAIAKAVVEAHGGSITAFNDAQGGAVFRFDLPTCSMPVEPVS